MTTAADPYLDYLARFEQQIGALSVGAYGKWKGKLVRKLAPDEFATKHGELTSLSTHYQKSLARGDTLNDALTKLLRERQVELLIDET
jgi:hypothetical protein